MTNKQLKLLPKRFEDSNGNIWYQAHNGSDGSFYGDYKTTIMHEPTYERSIFRCEYIMDIIEGNTEYKFPKIDIDDLLFDLI